jgi:hypothetical protein
MGQSQGREIMRALWSIKSNEGAIRSHVSDYRTVFDAFYEYTKNLEEAQAQNIHIELLHDRKVALVYGDSIGMGIPELDEIRLSIGRSSKGATHHGLGMLAFMRFAKKMVVVSKKNNQLYILSCEGEGDDIVSETGEAREVSSEDREYECYYRKLKALGDSDGTITILEGVGQYKSDRFDFQFDMKKEFDTKEFIKWLQEKLFFSLHYHNYFLKIEGGNPEITGKRYAKKEKIPAKVGTGKKYELTIPSAKFPAENIPGSNHDCFEYGGRHFKLRVKFMFYVGPSNDGNIQISEGCQNGLLVKEAIKIKLSGDSVFKNPDYASYLNGLIDFKVIPLDGGDGINVYSGTRSTLLIDNSFGDCLCNILTYADEEVIRPAISKAEKKSDIRSDDLRSQNLQKDMEMFFRDMRWVADEIMVTQHSGPVLGAGMVKCHKCLMTVVPKRGVISTQIRMFERNVIYSFDDIPKYRCGNCGTVWDRRAYDSSPSGLNPKLPIYKEPEKGEGVERQRRRGYGFSFRICPFDRGDDRRAMVFGDLVKINKTHTDYQLIEKDKRHKDTLTIYERLMAVEAITNHTHAQAHRDIYAEKLQKATASVLVWFQTKRQRLSSEEIDKLHEEDSVNQTQKSVNDLAEHWGAKKVG